MKLIENMVVTGTIEVVNGLHIGAGKEALDIGGLDNAVIKDPRTKSPYIPGSSIKGKMRFLTEWKLGKTGDKRAKENTHACAVSSCPICRIFGTLEPASGDGVRGITRLVVRDATLIGEFNPETMLEVKWGTAIDRMTGTAKGGSLRNIERVVPGVKFKFEIVYRVFDLDDDGKADRENFHYVIDALKHLENDTLGGSGSRGCGKIAFNSLQIAGSTLSGTYASLEDLLSKITNT